MLVLGSSLATPFDQHQKQPRQQQDQSPTTTVTSQELAENETIANLQQPLTIPAVRLDVEHISAAMAAQLAASLISHVLFLKSQIPFPVVQLARMPMTSTNPQATKKKTELLNAIDTLASHLYTTFRALSTAFAIAHAGSYVEGTTAETPPPLSSSAQTHMAVILGPSVNTPKARVMLVMTGLEVKHAGRPSSPSPPNTESDEDSDPELEEEGGDDDYESDNESECSDASSATPPEDSDSSRSPSPQSHESLGSRPPIVTFPTSAPSDDSQVLRSAERLLSRTLANACAEPDGGFSCELAPTQTHIVLRAPRHFDHPAWTPRQNITRTFDKSLQNFLIDATIEPDVTTKKKPTHSIGPKNEGVWVGSKGEVLRAGSECTEAQSDDDMIWWTWNGKIVGFSDW